MNIGRIALGGAAATAVAAIGIAVFRSTDKPPPPPAPFSAPAESPGAAIAKLEARLKADPNDTEGWQLLGWAFFETGRYAEAATAYRKATALAPNRAEYWSALGEATALSTSKQEMPKDAADAFRKAIALDPKDPRARYFLGVEKDLAGQHQAALDDWFALLKDTPSGAPWEADLRRTIEQVAAREKLDIAARLAAVQPAPPIPSTATAAIPGPTRDQMQAASQLPKGQQDAMVEGMVSGLEAKLRANPENPQGWIMLMRSRMMLGETAKAGAAWRSGVSANPNAKAQLDEAARQLGVPPT